MIGYKLVKVEEDKLVSLFNYTKSAVEYFLNTITYPKETAGPLVVFDTLLNALLFADIYDFELGYIKIFKIEYVPSDEKYIWDVGTSKEYGVNLELLPQGTDLASSVKLLEEFKYETRD